MNRGSAPSRASAATSDAPLRSPSAAAFAACGYAKYTGRLGVCLATSGPGGVHLLNGLYDAKCDGQPVLDEYRAKLAETQIEQVGARLRALNVREEAAEVHGVG